MDIIARLNEKGVPAVVLTGSPEFPSVSFARGTIVLEKPISEAVLLAHLRPLLIKKTTRVPD